MDRREGGHKGTWTEEKVDIREQGHNRTRTKENNQKMRSFVDDFRLFNVRKLK